MGAARFAVVPTATGTHDTIASYLPHNYMVLSWQEGEIMIGGVDKHGWTLDEYVIPRLASGMYYGHEVDVDMAGKIINSHANKVWDPTEEDTE